MEADKEGLTLTIWDESGFSFVPNRNHTWAPVGETPILRETPGRHNHTGVGFITRTPRRHLLKFRLTMFEGAASFEDFIFLLTDLHYYYRKKGWVLGDNLSAHYSAKAYFEETHPDWFELEYVPPLSPEWKPGQACWHRMMNSDPPNLVPKTNEEWRTAVNAEAERNNEKKQLIVLQGRRKANGTSPNCNGRAGKRNLFPAPTLRLLLVE
jgi:hypothetical protein